MHQKTISLILSMALSSVDPYRLVNDHILLSNTEVCIGQNKHFNINNVILIAMGKASVAMTQAAVDVFGDRISKGVCVCKTMPEKNPNWKIIEIIQGAHPVPNEKSLYAARKVSNLLEDLTEKDLVLVLISGGASALVASPVDGVSLPDLQKMNQLLLNSGATINEMNAVRKHLETLKGGGLARIAYPAKVETLILSDVIGNDVSVIASGPTVPDPSTFRDVESIFEKFSFIDQIPTSIRNYVEKGLSGQAPETVKPEDKIFNSGTCQIIGSNKIAVEAVKAEAEKLGLQAVCLSDEMVGEARERGEWFVCESQKIAAQAQKSIMIISGGETTVTIHGGGKGGRNQELALSTARFMAEDDQSTLITMATDGEDGPTDAAGAIVTSETMIRANELGLDPDEFLENNDAYTFFEKVDGLLLTGPTGTNVNDLTFYFRFH